MRTLTAAGVTAIFGVLVLGQAHAETPQVQHTAASAAGRRLYLVASGNQSIVAGRYLAELCKILTDEKPRRYEAIAIYGANYGAIDPAVERMASELFEDPVTSGSPDQNTLDEYWQILSRESSYCLGDRAAPGSPDAADIVHVEWGGTGPKGFLKVRKATKAGSMELGKVSYIDIGQPDDYDGGARRLGLEAFDIDFASAASLQWSKRGATLACPSHAPECAFVGDDIVASVKLVDNEWVHDEDLQAVVKPACPQVSVPGKPRRKRTAGHTVLEYGLRASGPAECRIEVTLNHRYGDLSKKLDEHRVRVLDRPAASRVPQRASATSITKVMSWAGMGAAAVALTGGLVAHGLREDAAADFNRSGCGVSLPDYGKKGCSDKYDDVAWAEIGMGFGYGGALGLTALSAYLLMSAPSDRASSGRVQCAPELGPGVSCTARF